MKSIVLNDLANDILSMNQKELSIKYKSNVLLPCVDELYDILKAQNKVEQLIDSEDEDSKTKIHTVKLYSKGDEFEVVPLVKHDFHSWTKFDTLEEAAKEKIF